MQSIQIQRQRQFNMPALMPRDVLFDTALLRYCFDAVLAVGVTGNWQQFVPFGHAVVFLDDVSGNVQQPDIRFDACFLAVRVDPQMPVERGAQVGFRQVRHIRPAQTRKGAEDEQIADQLVAFLFECAVDQECDFLLGQKTPFGLLLRDAVREERVALQQTVIDGHIDYFPERHHIRPDRVVAVILLGFEEQLEVGDERGGKLAQGDVADLVTLFDELREVFVHGAVFPIAARAFELAHLLLVILVVLTEYRQQRFVVHTQTEISIADFLGGYIIIPVGDLLVGLIDTHADFIQHAVRFLRGDAAAGDTA